MGYFRLILGVTVLGALTMTSIMMVQAGYEPLPPLRIYSHHSPLQLQSELAVLREKNVIGMTPLIADLGTDGVDELILAPGLNSEPKIQIRNKDGELLREFNVYHPSFGRGVTVAAGDVNGDGVKELITGTGYKAAPHIRVFNGYGEEQVRPGGFFAYAKESRAGVNVAAGNILGDATEEIITAPGYGEAPVVKIFAADGTEHLSFMAFPEDNTDGVSVAVGNFIGSDMAEIAVALEKSEQANIRLYRMQNGTATLYRQIPVEDYNAGVYLQAFDFDADGFDDIAVSDITGANQTVTIISHSGEILETFTPFELDHNYTARIAAGNLTGGANQDIVAMPYVAQYSRQYNTPQYIEVNLEQQQLYAWEHGRLAHSFLISSGLNRFPSPQGNYEIFRKLETHDYVWSYGENHPDNYDLRNVKYNLNFKPHFYIHHAWWHNNFGQQMSHGCINAPLSEVAWLFNWTQIDTPITIN